MTTTRVGDSVTLTSTGSAGGPGRTPPGPEVRVRNRPSVRIAPQGPRVRGRRRGLDIAPTSKPTTSDPPRGEPVDSTTDGG